MFHSLEIGELCMALILWLVLFCLQKTMCHFFHHEEVLSTEVSEANWVDENREVNNDSATFEEEEETLQNSEDDQQYGDSSEMVSTDVDILSKIQEILPANARRNIKHDIFWHNVSDNKELIAITTIIPELLKLGFVGEDIGVIAPNRSQAFSLKQFLSNAMIPISVCGVEESRSLERKIILISAVQAAIFNAEIDMGQDLGILTDSKRIHDTIYRFIPRGMAVIFGRADKLRQDEYWRALIEDCEENGTIFDS